MFRHWPCLPINFYFPAIRGLEKHCCFKLLHCWVMWMAASSFQGSTSASPLLRLRDRSDTMTERLLLYCSSQATWSWLKPMPTRGGGKWRTSGRRNCMKWNTDLLMASLHTSWRMSGEDAYESSTETKFFSPLMQRAPPLYGHASWEGQVHHHCPRGMNFRQEWGWASAKIVDCLPLAHWQAVETPRGWVNRKLCAVLYRHFLQYPHWIKGKKFNVEGLGVWEVNISILVVELLITLVRLVWLWLAMINSTLPLFILEITSS